MVEAQQYNRLGLKISLDFCKKVALASLITENILIVTLLFCRKYNK